MILLFRRLIGGFYQKVQILRVAGAKKIKKSAYFA
jgi:hypothetical protein